MIKVRCPICGMDVKDVTPPEQAVLLFKCDCRVFTGIELKKEMFNIGARSGAMRRRAQALDEIHDELGDLLTHIRTYIQMREKDDQSKI